MNGILKARTNNMGNILNRLFSLVYLPYQISPQRVHQQQGYCVAGNTGYLPFTRIWPESNLHQVSIRLNWSSGDKRPYSEQNDVSMSEVGIMNINDTGLVVKD